MSNPNAQRPPDQHPAVWIEQEVYQWVHCQIRGEPWHPGPVPERPVLIRKAKVLEITGLSHPTIWKKEKKGTFPLRVRIDAHVPSFCQQPVASS
jgi:predicted DNA-binding transcriptional regulator AlpA